MDDVMVQVIGSVSRAPEMRYLPSGTPMTNFSVAAKAGYGDKAYTQYWRVSTFGNLAETCNQYLELGQEVLVAGEPQGDPTTHSPKLWDGKDGAKRASFELTANKVKFGRKSQAQTAPTLEQEVNQEPSDPTW